MHKIIKKIQLSEEVFRMEVEAAHIARERKPGQFVIVQIDTDYGERIPLTIADADEERGTITLVFGTVGSTTHKLAAKNKGETIENILGPLGQPTHIENFGHAVCVGGGIGVAPLHPIAQGLKEAGNKVTIIIGARNKDLVILEDEMRAIADELIICTDDGSYGRKALVTEPLKELCEADPKPDIAVAIGPPIMMKFCAETTRPFDVHTVVSLNTIMVDGTGMCGGCRVTVGGETKFVCVDGPEFDGHKVDFDNMMRRLKAYKPQEDEDHHTCHLELEIQEAGGQAVMEYKPMEALQAEALKLLEAMDLNELSVKDRLAIPQQDMPSQDPALRVKNVNEVALGYTEEQMKIEAARCLQCKNAPCIKGCPVSINIPAFIKAASDGKYAESVGIIKETSMLPAICGRVCPQESQCMETCTVGKSLKDRFKSVAIGRIERFVADWESEHGQASLPEIKPATGKKVGIIGSGPAGLTAAADIRKEGHEVVIFEAFHKPGGVMVYGIPEFRLPKAIVQKEIDTLQKMGVELRTNFLIGRSRKLKDLLEKDGFDALFIGSGAGLPRFMGIDGENLVGVFSANEYLTRANLMKAYDSERAATPIFQSKKVAVFGGGNVAMDAARTARRLGADEVHLIYRRTRTEMPARAEEVEHAEEEGIIFHFLTNAKRIIGNNDGRVESIECLSYELGESDDSGRRRPVEIPGSEFIMEMDTVIPAIGNTSNPLIKQTTPELETDRRGNIVVDESGKTSIDRVYAGGDIVLGAATVILAMGEGRKAAASINRLLSQ
jgi:glutamate synthase (NADPH/NADH) small chain